jgi:osmotically-inducible protein OsmY
LRRAVTFDDERVLKAVEAELQSQIWMPGTSVTVVVKDGVVELSGIILDDRYREAIRVCAENVAGVKGVHDHLVFVEPYIGAYVDPEEAEAR